MKKRTFILFTSFLTGTIFSTYAGPFHSMEELDKLLPQVQQFKSIPSPKTFQVHPERTAAGVLHYAMDEEQGPVVLLGSRDDDKGYCNLGGLSEAKEGKKSKKKKLSSTLAATASREVEEESNGYYAHHPYELEQLPFVDLLSERKDKDSLLYRMYWKRVQKVDPKILMKAMEESEQDHSKEYKDFVWVPVNFLLKFLTQKKSSIIIDEKTSIELYEPLFHTLLTPTSLTFLQAISEKGVIPRFNKKIREGTNRLYVNNPEEVQVPNKKSLSNVEWKTHWDLPKSPDISSSEKSPFKDPRPTYTETLSNGKKIKRYKVLSIPFGHDAWGNTAKLLYIQGVKGPFKVNLSAKKDERDFAYAVAAHGAAMVELKQRAKAIQQKAKVYDEEKTPAPSVEGWNPKCDLSPSRIHLRIVLGPDFKTATDFSKTTNPQRKADIANLRVYLERYRKVEFNQKDVKSEFKRQINFTDHDLEVFADVLEWEEQHKQSPVFYHAAEANINNLWHTFTHLRELLSLSPLLGNKVALRGTDIYFRGIKTMEDILEKFDQDDYGGGRAAVVLCANYVLTAGLQTTQTSSSSVEYFLNNHSVGAPDINQKFEEATALAGIIGHYPFFRSLFLQYLAHQHPTFENSVMLGLSIPPHLLPDHSYASHGGGSKDFSSRSVLDVFKGIQSEYESHKDEPESFEERTEEKKALHPEARLSLHPDFALHSDVHVKAFSRFPLNAQQQKEFDREMRIATIGTLAEWLHSRFKVMPDSFISYPALKQLHHLAYKGMTGQDMKEEFAAESFFHLVSNGHVTAVKEFLTTFPEILKHKDYNPLSFAYAAIRSEKADMLKFICEELPKRESGTLFKNPKDFYKAITTAIIFESAECLDALLSSYMLSTIPEEVVRFFINFSDLEECPDEVNGVLVKHFPHYTSELLKRITFNDEAIEELLKLLGPKEIVEHYLKQPAYKKTAEFTHPSVLKMIAKTNLDLGTVCTSSKTPLIFEVLGFDLSYMPPEFAAYFSTQLPTLVDVKDSKGRTVFDHAQEANKTNTYNPLLALTTPYGLLLGAPPLSIDGLTFLGECTEALSSKNSEKLSHLAANIPPTISPTMISICEFTFTQHKDHPLVIALNQAAQTYQKVMAQARKALKDNDFRAFYLLYKENLSLIKYGLLFEDKLSLDDTNPYGHSVAFPPSNNEKTRFGSLLQKSNKKQALELLQRVYPDKAKFVSLRYFLITESTAVGQHPLLWAFDEGLEEVVDAIIEHLGNRLPELILSLDDLDDVLEEIPEEMARNLLKAFPKLIENERFFIECLGSLPSSLRKEFLTEHKEKLSEVSTVYGIPYFWSMYDGEETPYFLEYLKENPKLLDLKSITGLTWQEMLVDVLGAKETFKKLQRKLNHKRMLNKGEKVNIGSIALKHLGNAGSVIVKKNRRVTVTTDNNAHASYQLTSDRVAVQEGHKARVRYKVTVEPGGKVSLGLLNTNQKGWYGSEELFFNTEDKSKTFTGMYEREVPKGETETSLVFRNYHLGTAGQSTFTIEEADIEVKDPVIRTGQKATIGALKLTNIGNPQRVREDEGKITVVTNNNASASYQLESERIAVQEGHIIKVPYKVTVEPGGKVSLGLLNTNRNGWYGKEELFFNTEDKPKTFTGMYEREVPKGETGTSLVFRNYHLGTPGQSTFTIENLDFKVE